MFSNLILLVGGLVILALVTLVFFRARALERRIKEQLAQEEQGPKDPYAQMAELARVHEAISSQEKRSWPKD
jgi:hypothetical protein